MSGKAHQQQQKIFFKESFFRFFMLALLKSLHRHKNGKMAKALTPYVCMMIFLSTPVKRNVCKSHFYATQTSLSLSLTYTQFSIHDGWRKSLFFWWNSCCIEKRFCLRKLSLTTEELHWAWIKKWKGGIKTLARNTISKFNKEFRLKLLQKHNCSVWKV